MHTQGRYATRPKGVTKKKKEKRCIPEEGMPHVHMSKKRRKKIYIVHVQEKNTRREIDHAKEFIHYPPKISHTLAPLDQVV